MKIIAHRGASAYEAENTLPSFKKAIKMRADGAECDVRLTRDKKLVVIHDEAIDRTTSGKGKVKNHTLNQLKKYGLPELKEVINLIKPKKFILFIEIKERGTEKKIAETIRECKAGDKVIVVSSFPESIKKIKNMDKGIRGSSGLIFAEWGIKPFKTAEAVKADWLIPHHSLLTRAFVNSAHEKGLKILAWTVNRKRLAKKLESMGVDAIATNKPDLMKRQQRQQRL